MNIMIVLVFQVHTRILVFSTGIYAYCTVQCTVYCTSKLAISSVLYEVYVRTVQYSTVQHSKATHHVVRGARDRASRGARARARAIARSRSRHVHNERGNTGGVSHRRRPAERERCAVGGRCEVHWRSRQRDYSMGTSRESIIYRTIGKLF